MLRPYRPEDVAAVLELYARAHHADPTLSTMHADEWRAFVAAAHNRGGADFALIELDGRVEALATTAQLDDPRVPGGVRTFRAVVHPAHRRRGLARALLEHVAALAEREDAGVLQSVVRERWEAGRAFLGAAGFSPAFADVLLRRRVGGAPLPALPKLEGVRLRSFAGAADCAAWASLANEGFARDAAGTTETADSVAAHARASGFDLHVAEDAASAQMVGFCHQAYGAPGHGEIQGLVVRRGYEGRGIGTALLQRALGALEAGGCTSAELVTESDNHRALALYDRHGFERRDTLTAMRRARTRRAGS